MTLRQVLLELGVGFAWAEDARDRCSAATVPGDAAPAHSIAHEMFRR